MYVIVTEGKRAEKEFKRIVLGNEKFLKKIDLLLCDPRSALDAHPLRGRLRGKWSCRLADDVRIVYLIDDQKKLIRVERVGSHKNTYGRG